MSLPELATRSPTAARHHAVAALIAIATALVPAVAVGIARAGEAAPIPPARDAATSDESPHGEPVGFSVLMHTDQLLLPGKGRFFAGIGGEARPGWRQDYSGLEGTLLRYGVFGVQVAFSDSISVRLDGSLVERLEVNTEDSDPEPGFDDSGAVDVGTPRFATILRLAPQRGAFPGFGLVFAATIPTTDDREGIGLDTTDVFASSVWDWRRRRFALAGNLGLGILDSPSSVSEQNDVLTYGLRGRLGMGSGERWDLVGEVQGHASTRGHAPRGTQDRSVLRLGITRNSPALRWEAVLSQGLVRRDGDLGFGFALTWSGGRRDGRP